MSIQIIFRWAILVAVNIQSNSRSTTSSTAKSEYKSWAINKHNSQTLKYVNSLDLMCFICWLLESHLFCCDRMIDRVGILKIISKTDFVDLIGVFELFSDKVRLSETLSQVLHHFIRRLRIALFVIVSGEEVSAVFGPVLVENLLDTLLFRCQDR